MATKNFRNFIIQQLKYAGMNEVTSLRYTSSTHMSKFLAAFTHPSIDPQNNYQNYEFLGDRVLKGVLAQLIMAAYPNISYTNAQGKQSHEGIYTKLNRYYESTKYFLKFSQQAGFHNFARISEEEKTNTNKYVGDMFEAFIGALVTVVDSNMIEGMGYVFAMQYMRHFMPKESFAPLKDALYDAMKQDPISTLQQLYAATKEGSINVPKGGAPLGWGQYMDGNTQNRDGAKTPVKKGAKIPIYQVYTINAPRYPNNVNPTKGAKNGDVIDQNGKIRIFYNGAWVDYTRQSEEQPLPNDWVLQAYSIFHYPEGGVEKWSNKLHIVSARGLYKYIGKTISAEPTEKDLYVLGQGIYFDIKTAKADAARNVLNYLGTLGYTLKVEDV